MNTVTLVGRLTADPDVRYSQDKAIARFRVAVDRRFKNDGQPTADFIPVVTFGKTGEFIEKYFRKGMRIGITGRIQTGSYKKEDGSTVYTWDVVGENVEFVESKGSGAPAQNTDPVGDGDFMDIPDGISDELPFA